MSGGQVMVVLIVMIVMIASIMKARVQGRWPGSDAPDDAENRRLQEEVKELKERLHVLERIATDRENSLSREIEQLRDR